MKVAIMQPYFFPYIGYFQLLNAVDTFVVYDNVNYIKKGWINRNRIILNKQEHLLTLPVQDISQNKHINQHFLNSPQLEFERIKKKLFFAYNKSPNYLGLKRLIDDCFSYEETNIAIFNAYCLSVIAKYLGISCNFIMSSDLDLDLDVFKNPQDRIIQIIKQLDGDQYLNLPGGQKLYNHETFESENIGLEFIQPNTLEYLNLAEKFIPNLSILDIIANVEPKKIQSFL
jgi:hypothetical protein